MVAGDFNEDAAGPRLRGLIESGLVEVAANGEATAAGGRVDYLLVSAPPGRNIGQYALAADDGPPPLSLWYQARTWAPFVAGGARD